MFDSAVKEETVVHLAIQFGSPQTGSGIDTLCLFVFLQVWFGEHMFSDDFCFYTGYKIPKCRGLQQFFEAIQALPSVDTPQVFGLHPNADIT